MIHFSRHPDYPAVYTAKVTGDAKEFQNDLSVLKKQNGNRYDANSKEWLIPFCNGSELFKQYQYKYDWKFPTYELIDQPIPSLDKDINIDASETDYFSGRIMNHQTIGSSFLYGTRRVICADEVGIGKTITAIRAALKGLKVYGDIQNVLIFTRASIKHQWAREIASFTDCTVGIIHGSKKQREKQWKSFEKKLPNFLICNWDQLILEPDIDYMKNTHWDAIIGDEAHIVGNRKTDRAKAFKDLRSKYMWLLTATPINGKAERAFTLIDFLAPGYLGSATSFEKNFCIKDSRFGWDIVGSKNMSDLYFKVDRFIICRKQEDVGGDLPSIIYQDYTVEPTSAQKNLLSMLDEKIMETTMQIDLIPLNNNEMKPEYERLSGLVRGYLNLQIEVASHPKLLTLSDSTFVQQFAHNIKGLDASPKMTELLAILENRAESGHKVVVFTEFARMAELIVDKIHGHKPLKGISAVMLTGQMPKDCNYDQNTPCGGCSKYSHCNSRRKSLWKYWNEDNCLVFVSTSAGGEGINLQISKQLINYDLPWDPMKWEQRAGRIKRIGAEHKSVIITNLLMEGSIDEMILKTHEKKRNVINQLIRKTDTSIWDKALALLQRD